MNSCLAYNDNVMQEHMKGPEAQARELEELTQIYVGRGLSYSLAKKVTTDLTPILFSCQSWLMAMP
jgi:hypothetical protein